MKYAGVSFTNDNEYEFITTFNNIMCFNESLLYDYKNNKYSDDLVKLGEILKVTINSGINNLEYKNVFILLVKIFNKIKNIVIISQGLTNDYV